jgi:hypothetical protein
VTRVPWIRGLLTPTFGKAQQLKLMPLAPDRADDVHGADVTRSLILSAR